MGDLQQRLFAGHRRSLLIVLQVLDAGGKDGVIQHVIGSMSPDGCHVANFKEPAPQELSHDFLWRIEAETPARGENAIFKWFRDLAVSEIIVSAMESMNFQVPKPTVDIDAIRRKYHAAARKGTLARKSDKRRGR